MPAYAIGGFSAGPRTCIGKHLARLEAKIGLIKFMKRYRKIELFDRDVAFGSGFMYQPKNVLAKMTKS